MTRPRSRWPRGPGRPVGAYQPGAPPGVEVMLDPDTDGRWYAIAFAGDAWAWLSPCGGGPPIAVPASAIVHATREPSPRGAPPTIEDLTAEAHARAAAGRKS